MFFLMSGHIDQHAPFGSIRRFFWPIHSHELKKFIPLSLMMFCILFNYTILRNTKDTLVITASGPEVIPFLKGVVVLPFSILIVGGYSKLVNLFSQSRVFYIMLASFMTVYVGYVLFIHPNISYLHMSPERLMALKKAYPMFQHFFSLIGHWSSSLFYLCAELWGATILSLMFWQFANEITRVAEAKRFYAMFGLIAHFALIFAGKVGKGICKICGDATDPSAGWTQYINYMLIPLCISAALTAALYWWVNRYVLTDPKYYDGLDRYSDKKQKRPKLSLKESFKLIAHSKYLGYIAMMVIGYGVTMNLTGIMWKKQVQLQFPNPIDYANFMFEFSSYVGIATIILIFLFKNIVDRFGWFKGAIVTPIILSLTVIPFFAFMFYRDMFSNLSLLSGVSALMVAIVIGGVQQILCKSSKYSTFDPTKEMAYIPIDPELRSKGKAAVDVSGYSFAKALGGYVSGGLLIVTAAADLMTIAPYLAVIVVVVTVLWSVSIKKLSKLYYGQLHENQLHARKSAEIIAQN